MKNKIVLIEEDSFGSPNVLIFSNERDIKQHFENKDCTIEINDDSVIVKRFGIKTRYSLQWAKEVT